jgi:hypothetical protein
MRGNPRRCQAENPLISLFRFPEPALTYVSEFALTPPSPYVAASSIYVCAKGDTITDVEISAKAGVIPGIIKQGFPKFILVLIFERIWAAIRIQYLGTSGSEWTYRAVL